MPTFADLFAASRSGQHARLITLETAADAGLPASLAVERFGGREGINELFCFDIDVLSTSTHIGVSQGKRRVSERWLAPLV